MNFKAARGSISNRGTAPIAFLTELVEWAKQAPDFLFDRNANFDIYNKVSAELGPFKVATLQYRKAAILEVLRVLALFESSCNWMLGVDTSRSGPTNNENKEAGAWQSSYNARSLDTSLRSFLVASGITGGIEFQRRLKEDHKFAMEFTVRLLRVDIANYERIHNGPIRRGEERQKTWPHRPNLWSDKESIYPYLSREAVAEFEQALAA